MLRGMAAPSWDWTQHLFDHVDVFADDYDESVRFYEAVLPALGIPKLSEEVRGERAACFTRLNVVDRRPPTRDLHLSFRAGSRDEVDAFHRAGVDAGFRSNGRPGYRDYGPGYYAAYLLDPNGNNVEALYRDVGNVGHED
jgi:catechol 2,3-dioxygenase-like lactoylglutathione lyase family enzyme